MHHRDRTSTRRARLSGANKWHYIPFHSIPFRSIPFRSHSHSHSVPFRSIPIPFHSIPIHSHCIPIPFPFPFRSIPLPCCSSALSSRRNRSSTHIALHSIPFQPIPSHSIPFRSVPFPLHSHSHSIPFRSIPPAPRRSARAATAPTLISRSIPFRSIGIGIGVGIGIAIPSHLLLGA